MLNITGLVLNNFNVHFGLIQNTLYSTDVYSSKGVPLAEAGVFQKFNYKFQTICMHSNQPRRLPVDFLKGIMDREGKKKEPEVSTPPFNGLKTEFYIKFTLFAHFISSFALSYVLLKCFKMR